MNSHNLKENIDMSQMCLYFTTRQKRNKQATPQIYINFNFTELHFQATFCGSVLGRDWQLPQLSLHQTRLKRSRQGVQRHPSQT